MRKKIIIAIFTALFAFALAGCASGAGEDKGGANTLTIADITVFADGAPVPLDIKFSGKTEIITYEYDEYTLAIADNAIVCYKVGTFTVKAKSASCKTEFAVTCKNAVEIDDMYAWIGFPPADIAATINVATDKALTYEYDSSALTITDNRVTAIKEGKHEVTAIADGYKTYFTVECIKGSKTDGPYYMWGDGWDWNNKASSRRLRYNTQGHDGKSTLFMGDSFFDPDFFTSFYSFYGDYDALCLGIGGTTSHQWEMFFDADGVYTSGKYGQFAGIKPKNIVFQLGNNNIYNDKIPAEESAEDMQRFFTFIHSLMPDTMLYYFGVTARSSAPLYDSTVKNFNKLMDKYCAKREWIVFMDTSDKMTADKLVDTIHPKPEAYKIFVDALEQAGLKLEY